MAPGHQRLGQGQAGIDVAARPAPGDEGVDRPLRDRPSLHRPCRATLRSTPLAHMVKRRADPPNDTNGQRHAGDRQGAGDGADVDDGLADDPAGDPGGQQGTEPVGGPQRRPHAEHGQGAEEDQHQGAADQPELLADDGEDEVGVGVGEEQPLGPAGAETDARPPAAAEGDERLGDLVAALLVVLERVDERHQPGPAVGLDDGQEASPPRSPPPRTTAMCRTGSPPTKRMLPVSDGHRDGRAHVGLEHHERRRRSRTPARPAAAPPASRRRWRPAGRGGRRSRAAARAWPAPTAGSGPPRCRATGSTR